MGFEIKTPRPSIQCMRREAIKNPSNLKSAHQKLFVWVMCASLKGYYDGEATTSGVLLDSVGRLKQVLPDDDNA